MIAVLSRLLRLRPAAPRRSRVRLADDRHENTLLLADQLRQTALRNLGRDR